MEYFMQEKGECHYLYYSNSLAICYYVSFD